MSCLRNTPADSGAAEHAKYLQARKSWFLMIWLLALAPVLPLLVTPRVYDAHYSNFISAGANHQGVFQWFLGKLTTYGILTLACLIIAKYRKVGRAARSWETRKILIAVIVYALAPFLVTLFVSKSKPSLGMLGLPLIFTATYFLPAINPGEIAKQIRIALATLYIYGSILAVLIAPKWAVESGYSTEMSYTVFRLYGMAVHANILAAFLFTFITLGWMPGARLRKEKTHVALALLLMAASQSKTVIAIFLIVYFLKVSGKTIRYIYSRKMLAVGVLLSFAGIAAAVVTAALQNKAVQEIIRNPETITLTGRVMLWGITLSLWLEKPWFGYGADMWNAEMQQEYAPLMGGWLAPHAHNQVLQTLGEAGAVGAFLLLILYYVFARASWRLYSFTGGVSFFLFTYVALRSLTEVPIVLAAVQSNFINFWAVFAILITSLRCKASMATAEGTLALYEK